MDETTYLKNDEVTITNSRIIVPNQTYAISGITSVKFAEQKPNRLLPIALMIGGFFLAKSSPNASIWHFLVIESPFVIWLLLQKTTYCVKLSSSSGESKALVSRKKDFVQQVIDAINKAIIDRG